MRMRRKISAATFIPNLVVYEFWQRSSERQWSLTQLQDALSRRTEPPLFTIRHSETLSPWVLMLTSVRAVPCPSSASEINEMFEFSLVNFTQPPPAVCCDVAQAAKESTNNSGASFFIIA